MSCCFVWLCLLLINTCSFKVIELSSLFALLSSEYHSVDYVSTLLVHIFMYVCASFGFTDTVLFSFFFQIWGCSIWVPWYYIYIFWWLHLFTITPRYHSITHLIFFMWSVSAPSHIPHVVLVHCQFIIHLSSLLVRI